MRKLMFILIALIAFQIPQAPVHAQGRDPVNLMPIAPAYYPLKIAKFNASYRRDQQATYYTSLQIGKMSNAGYTDTTQWIPLPLIYEALDTTRLGVALKTNLDTLSCKITAQVGFAGAVPDSSVANAGIFASLTGAALSADNFVISRKTTTTYHVADFARLLYKAIPPGATHIRFFNSWQASGQSIESDGAETDQYELYFVWPQRE